MPWRMAANRHHSQYGAQVLSLAEAAQSLGIEHDTLRRQIRLGKMKARKVGPIWTVTEREVERYRKEHLRDAATR